MGLFEKRREVIFQIIEAEIFRAPPEDCSIRFIFFLVRTCAEHVPYYLGQDDAL